MAVLFGRNYSVTISPVNGGTQVIVRENRITFDIAKTSASEPNRGTIKIYNLSENTRNLIKDIDYVLTFEAGYKNDIGIILKGSIVDVTHSLQGVDVVTTIDVEDGGKEIRTKRISKSFAEGYSLKKMIKEVSGGLSLPFKVPEPLLQLEDSKIIGGEAFNCQIKTALDRLGKQAGFSWSSQNGEIVFSVDYKIDSNEVAVLNSSTGLIGSPERIIVNDANGKELKGWRVRSLMNPKIIPTNQVVIQSKEISRSNFKVDNCKISGDSFGGEWVVDMEVVEV